MERSGSTPVADVHVGDIDALLRRPGPFLTAYLATPPDRELAGVEVLQRWKRLRTELDASGVPEETLDAVESALDGSHRAGRGVAVVADSSSVLHVEHGPTEPKRDLAVWSPLPRLVPVLEWRQTTPIHVLVRADRRGADVIVYRWGEDDLAEEVEGENFPLRKVGPGGWSQRRFQERAENTWEENADGVAERVAELADAHGARLVVGTGDERALVLLAESLPDRLRDRWVTVPGGRSPDGSDEDVASETVRAADTAVAADTTRLLRKFREELGQNDRAVAGPEATIAALQASQVDVLLVHDDPDDTREAWFGERPDQLALDRDSVEALGERSPHVARLVDVAVRAALGTGAAVRVVPGATVHDGLGALLRWA